MREIEEEVRGRQSGVNRFVFPGASGAEKTPCPAQNSAVLE
jgi:hypothetical protein